jgi:hypothetical protein
MEVRRRHIWTIQWVVVGQTSQTLQHGLQTGRGPGIIVLQEKSCLLLWPDPGNLGIQLSQCCDVAVRVDGLSRFQEIAGGSRHSSFHELAAVLGRTECGLPLTSLSLLLKCNTHCLTVLTSTVWSPLMFSKYQ